MFVEWLIFLLGFILTEAAASQPNVWHQNQQAANSFKTQPNKYLKFENEINKFSFDGKLKAERKKSRQGSEESLLSLLEGLKFLHKGTVHSSDVYRYHEQQSAYTEPENVTVVDQTWTTRGGKLDYLYKVGPGGNLTVPPLGMRSAVALGGISTGSTELRADGTFHEWMIQNASPAGAAKIAKLPELLFGIRTERSGGDAEGEGGAAKGEGGAAEGKGGATEGERGSPVGEGGVPEVQALVLQTHPERELLEDTPGVEAIEYSGAHPVSKLKIKDGRLPVNVTLYAYSTYSVGDMRASAAPAVLFTFVVHNPTDVETDVSLMMNLPSREYQTARTHLQGGQGATPKHANTSKSAEDCRQMCANMGSVCASWVYDKNTSMCYLYDNVTLSTYDRNKESGLNGRWVPEDVPGMNAQCLTYQTPGTTGPSGNISSCPLVDKNEALPIATASSTTASMATGSFLRDLWPQFKANGGFDTNTISGSGLSGATAIKTMIPPHQNKTVTFLMPWNYPHRDFLNSTPGNRYSLFYPDTQSVAEYLNTNLLGVVRNISVLHSAFTGSSLPPFLQDIFINSLSHIRSAMWFRDGRWRQWEAHDCTNIDSVHNDGERHVPYLSFFPESVRNKLDAWATGQVKTGANKGMIQEQLRCGCSTVERGSDADIPCGRVMSDVSSMFIVYVLELYKWAGDNTTLTKLWANVKEAAQWHIDVSEKLGVPEHLVNTYDVLNQNMYDLCTYNSAFHILAMAAAKELAMAVGDTSFAGKCQQTLENAQDAMDNLQWNDTAGYYNSYTDLAQQSNPGAIMTDTFYSQVLAYSLDLGQLVKNQSRLLNHMRMELERNDSPVGMLVQTGRYKYPGPQQDNAVWLMGNPNWATINIHLKQDVNKALSVANKTLNWWREVVNDLWNIPAIAGGLGYGAAGQPWGSSHYGYFMSSWHLVFALSGQKADLPGGTLAFDSPDPSATWAYPVLLPGVLGKVSQTSSDTDVELKLEIYAGQLVVSKNLSIRSVAYQGPYPLVMNAGDKISFFSHLN